jgi:hypothetical protein
MESFRVSGLEVELDDAGRVFHQGKQIGRVGRERRFEQWFWRAYDPENSEAYKRFFTTRPEAVQLLLIHADALDGLGF